MTVDESEKRNHKNYIIEYDFHSQQKDYRNAGALEKKNKYCLFFKIKDLKFPSTKQRGKFYTGANSNP